VFGLKIVALQQAHVEYFFKIVAKLIQGAVIGIYFAMK